MTKAGDKVTLEIGNLSFTRTVEFVKNGAAHLVEGGDAFDAITGYVWGTTNSVKRIIPAQG